VLVIEVVKKYLEELERNNIPVQEAIIFGSRRQREELFCRS
jgi:hypothetical protein